MKQYNLISLGLFVALALQSCATILSGTRANVTVTSTDAQRANVIADGESYPNVSFPVQVKVKRGFTTSIIRAENEELEGEVTVGKKFNPASLGNILLGGIPGYIVDVSDGAVMKPEKKDYVIAMTPKKRSNNLEERVENQSVTQTFNMVDSELDQTIIRWDVQSRPQGADIFWRVVSKTPNVKSTNNKYLTTTPYEATKALDIKGLTYQNSGNVRIILRCEKDGYLPQEKEYDVRMIIDQEEISSFFRLVKEE